MRNLSTRRLKLLSILLTGAVLATVGAIGMATQQENFALAQAAGYVPFRVLTASLNCDKATGAADADKLTINGNSDFMVNSIVLRPTGINSGTDSVTVLSYGVDGTPAFGLNSQDITGGVAVSDASEILGLPSTTGGMLPTNIAATGAGSSDIVIFIVCNAGTTADINLTAEVYGWKLSGDTVTAVLTES
ncbi:MAG: hypothetical protein ACREBU_05315 [Nitrososphaera sp.]